MSQFKRLYIFKEEGITQPLVYLNDFHKLMKENVIPSDKLKFRTDNFMIEFRRHKTGIYDLNHGRAVTVTSVMRYIFRHFDDFVMCHNLGLDIENIICKAEKAGSVRTVSELYKEISKQQLFINQLDQQLQDIPIDCENIPSIHLDYRNEFEEGWQRICVFENYFSKFYNKDLPFEQTLKEKWSVFETIKSLKETSKKIPLTTKKVIRNRTERKESYKETRRIEILAGMRHHPTVIEKHLFERIDSLYVTAVDRIVCIDTHESQSNNSLMVCVSLDSTNDVDFNGIASVIIHVLQQHHTVNTSYIHFLPSYKLNHYLRSTNSIDRFSLRDDLINRTNEMNIVFSVQPTSGDGYINDIKSDICVTCFSSSLPKPLDISTFDVLQEWYLDVPLDIQIVFQTFLNSDSMRRSGDKRAFVKRKLDHLYRSYDALLKTFNSQYFGVHKQANMDEPSMHFEDPLCTAETKTCHTEMSESTVPREKSETPLAHNEQEQLVVNTGENVSSDDSQQLENRPEYEDSQPRLDQPQFGVWKPRYGIEIGNDAADIQLANEHLHIPSKTAKIDALNDQQYHKTELEKDHYSLGPNHFTIPSSQSENMCGTDMPSPNQPDYRPRKNTQPDSIRATDRPHRPQQKQRKQFSFSIASILHNAKPNSSLDSNKISLRSCLPVPHHEVNLSQENSTVCSHVCSDMSEMTSPMSLTIKTEIQSNDSPTTMPDNNTDKLREQTVIGHANTNIYMFPDNVFIKVEPESDENVAPNKMLILDHTAERSEASENGLVNTKQVRFHQACNDDVAVLRSSYNVSVNNHIEMNPVKETIVNTKLETENCIPRNFASQQQVDDLSVLHDDGHIKTEVAMEHSDETGIT